MFDLLHSSYHRYYLFSVGSKLKAKYYSTRKDAEIAMYTYCVNNGLRVEPVENDKHEKSYIGTNGQLTVEFQINRE